MAVEPDRSVKIGWRSVKDDFTFLDIGGLMTSMAMNKLFTFIRPGGIPLGWFLKSTSLAFLDLKKSVVAVVRSVETKFSTPFGLNVSSPVKIELS